MSNKAVCDHCGAKVVKYTFTFNKGLARCLYLMRNHHQGVEIKTLKMTSSMWTNFQKLRYWGLIEPVMGENTRKGGYWKITRLGSTFLQGGCKIPKKVVMFRNKLDSESDELISFSKVTDGYEYREDYKQQIKSVSKGQP